MLEGYVEITHEIPSSFPPKRNIGNKIDIINSSRYVHASVITFLHITPFILEVKWHTQLVKYWFPMSQYTFAWDYIGYLIENMICILFFVKKNFPQNEPVGFYSILLSFLLSWKGCFSRTYMEIKNFT